MILDIHYFMMAHDSFGHCAGDELLKQVQKRISENIRVTDLLARFGGEEIVVVMPDTNVSDAYTIAERKRKIIAREPFTFADKNTTHNITVSIGIAEMQESDLDDIKKFIVRADKYLHKTKDSGRNRVVTGYS